MRDLATFQPLSTHQALTKLGPLVAIDCMGMLEVTGSNFNISSVADERRTYAGFSKDRSRRLHDLRQRAAH